MALQKYIHIFNDTLILPFPNQHIDTFDQWLNVALQQYRIGIRPTTKTYNQNIKSKNKNKFYFIFKRGNVETNKNHKVGLMYLISWTMQTCIFLYNWKSKQW
jgi:hypothetical protein